MWENIKEMIRSEHNEIRNRKILNQRVSLRRYQDKAITKEDLEFILHGAMRAPTVGDMMLYSIIKVEDEQAKLTLSKTCDNQAFIANAPAVLTFCADYQRWYDYFEKAGVQAEAEARNEIYMKHQKRGILC